MSISLFSHDANPDVDPRLCRKSNSYVAELVRRGEARMLGEGRAQLYPPRVTVSQPALVSGRNSCRKITNEDGVRYVVKHFSYPIPISERAFPPGLRGKGMSAGTINEPPKKPLGP